MLQSPQLALHLVPTVRLMSTLRRMATSHPILSKPLTLNSYPIPPQAVAGRPSSIRINMRINQFPFHSPPFQRRSHSNTMHPRHSPRSNRPPTPTPVEAVASTMDVTSVHYVAVQGHSNADPFQVEHQQSDRCTTRAPRERPKKNPTQ